jgi:hypothetical protein
MVAHVCGETGQVVLKPKIPYRDGTTQIIMEPLEFVQRLAALGPRPRLHLIRFYGVLAPNAKLCYAIVPAAKTERSVGMCVFQRSRPVIPREGGH